MKYDFKDEIKCKRCGITKRICALWCINPVTGLCDIKPEDIVTHVTHSQTKMKTKKEILIELSLNDSAHEGYASGDKEMINRWLTEPHLIATPFYVTPRTIFAAMEEYATQREDLSKKSEGGGN